MDTMTGARWMREQDQKKAAAPAPRMNLVNGYTCPIRHRDWTTTRNPDCPYCTPASPCWQDEEREADRVCAMVDAGRISHSRIAVGCWRTHIMVYGGDPSTPTGVSLVGSVIEPLLERAGLVGPLSPLSPTEAR